MKYIRTKDGIYENNTNVLIDNEETRIFILGKYASRVLEIINQADTIEELCDEFVIVLDNGTHRFVRSLSGKGRGGITWYRQRNYKIIAIYGAIWTDKGLIYVAKMNEKGCLKLL